MSVVRSQLRLGLFVAVLLVLCVNALTPWGDDAAGWVNAALQISTGLGALVCSVVAARRSNGVARAWRLLVAAALTSWLVAEVIWSLAHAATGRGTAPAVSVAAYFLPPVLSLVALVLLASSAGAVLGERDGPLRPSQVIAVLDGLVAVISFSILVIMAGSGGLTGAALPRSGNTAIALAYSVLELIVVVTAMLIAILYLPDRPYRANYLLLAGGVVVLASADRTIAYFQTVGTDRGVLWASMGFVLGPLMIAYSVLRYPTTKASAPTRDVMDWAQLVLPYIGFLGNALLVAYHLLIGGRLSPIVICLAFVEVFLVAARQVIAMRAQRVLTQRLYEVQHRLAHQVHHDALTGLPNRVLFAERLDEAISSGPFVLIFVDLDDFKEVNDRFGHAGGDELLRAVGERLRVCIGDADTLARIGGDEFAILINGGCEVPEVVADRIRVALRNPFAVHGSAIRVRASMGLVRPNPDGPRPTSDDLLRQADVSMYAGKRFGKDTAVIYRPSLAVSTDFPTALRQAKGGIPPGFTLAYQPIVQLSDGTPVAVEALARWTTPNGTQIQPDAFVATAEAAGLGATLDAMVLDLACREVQAADLDLAVHVNIGAARLGSLEFEQQLVRTLTRCGMSANQLVLEVTETVPIVDLADAAAQISRLNELGVRVALDDFGAGFNSLTYLHALPVQIIKLDRGLAVGADPGRNVKVYRSVVRLCDALGLDVIAEGIESDAQADAVYAAGCRLAQGHLFGQAAPITGLRSSVRLMRQHPVTRP